MPIYTFKCKACGKEFDKICPTGTQIAECECGLTADKQITAHKGYSIGGDNGASTKPSQSGSFKKS
jgi:putative FmdB family regulatory protein